LLRREWDDCRQWTPKNKYLLKEAHAYFSFILKMSMAIILDSLLPSNPPPRKDSRWIIPFPSYWSTGANIYLGRRGKGWCGGRDFAEKCRGYFSPGAGKDDRNINVGSLYNQYSLMNSYFFYSNKNIYLLIAALYPFYNISKRLPNQYEISSDNQLHAHAMIQSSTF
jgi:hypothetical protein